MFRGLLLSVALGSAALASSPEAPQAGVDFDTQIVPILTKAGCNAGACHGAAAGRGGFRLSLLGAGPREQAEFVSESLLGIRLRCANCHDHPLDRWTQDDYHGLAAVFARLERGRQVRLAERGEVTHPRSGEPAVPRIPGVGFLSPGADGRPRLAQWITSPDNEFFACAVVNRLWKALMGRGLVEPADDLRATNPATHPRLLDRLAGDFAAHGYDVRHTLRLIAASAAYQRDSRATPANQADDRFYSHALARALPAEVLADAVADVTGVPDRYADLPAGTRAVALFDSKIPSAALDALGRCPRDAACEASAVSGGLSKTLYLINGDLINAKVTAGDGRLHARLAAGAADGELLDEFYLRALGRPPSADEHAFWSQRISSSPDRRAAWEDFLWSLLNCREFRTNH